MKKTIHIEGMSCMHCSNAVTKALESVKGVKSVSVDLRAKTAVLEADDNVLNDALALAIDEAGYEVLGIE